MRPKSLRLLAALVIVAFVGTGPSHLRTTARAQNLEVDLALVLAVDVSWSVDLNEFMLQMNGLANAFRQEQIHDAIKNGPHGKIAVSSIQWSDETHQILNIPWTIVDSPQSALAFADTLQRAQRKLAEGGTSIGAALAFATKVLKSAPVRATRRVIDLSSDGRNNRGPSERKMRDLIAAQGITINGLAILNEWPTLDKYFERNVIGGPYHFVVPSNDYAAFSDAIYRKLLQEITGPGIS